MRMRTNVIGAGGGPFDFFPQRGIAGILHQEIDGESGEKPLKTMYQLYEDAWTRGEAHAAYLASIRHRTLDEQLEKFKAEGIAA
jgi:hypothetical protein